MNVETSACVDKFYTHITIDKANEEANLARTHSEKHVFSHFLTVPLLVK